MPIHIQRLETKKGGGPQLCETPVYTNGLRTLARGSLSFRNIREAVEAICEWHDNGRLERLLSQCQEGKLSNPWRRYNEFRHLLTEEW